MSTYIIGDIHSGARALEQVLERVQPSKEDTFLFLGDYVDGWSEAVETVDFLLDFEKRYSCVFIKGNHDYLTYRYLKKGEQNPLWLASGGQQTVESYAAVSTEKKKQHMAFYAQLKNYHIDSENRLFVHAGFTNVKGPRYEYFEKMVFWDRTLWELARSLDPTLSQDNPNYPNRLLLFKEIYIGHTPVTRLGKTVPLNYANVWNLDTGAAYKGPLSLMDVDTKQVWQSDPVYTLYPLESGRN